MAEANFDPGQAWLVRRVQVGHGFGMLDSDDRFSDVVSMDLWCQDLDKPGRFALSPDDADQLADALRDCAQRAREMKAP